MSNLSRLLAPISEKDFFQDFWQIKPFHAAHNDLHYYDSILTVPEIDGLIASGHLRYPALQIARGGGYLPPEAYTRSVRTGDEYFTGILDLDRVNAEYKAGSTISLPAVQRASAGVAAFTAALEEELDHAVQANVYLTPGGVPGFSPHYDTHDIFILQLGGHKLWKIYEPPLSLPHRTQPFLPKNYLLPEKPILQIDLSPGDLLYLPRGYVHTTMTGKSYSAHLTTAITVYTWIELGAELLQTARDIPRFRKALPVGFSRSEHPQDLLEQLFDLLDELRNEVDRNALMRRFLRQARSRRCGPENRFRSEVSIK